MKVICFLIIISGCILPQQHGTGILLDEGLYSNVKRSAALLRGDFSSLPSAFSLNSYVPAPMDQGSHATCAGWAVAYYGKTILEAVKNKWNADYINLNTFSPEFIYNKITNDPTCNTGVSLNDAIRVLKDFGALKMSRFSSGCGKSVSKKDLQEAEKYRIKDYSIICDRGTKNKTRIVKKILTENRPVIIAMDCPESFFSCGEFWIPLKEEYREHSKGHAVTVTGYDDNINGGSFSIINSWGNQWGKNGSTWIRYTDFEIFTFYAFDLIDYPADTSYALKGRLTFLNEQGERMKVRFNGKYFEMQEPYASGTKFQVFLSNYSPAYIYALGTDLKNNIFKILPSNDNTSPYLPFRKSNIAIPDEYNYNMLDEVKGKSYFVFIYSRDDIDFDKIFNEAGRKPVSELISKYADSDNVLSGSENINFEAGTGINTIFIFVEFKHT